MRKIYFFLLSVLAAGAVSAQISLTNGSSSYTQDFDGMAATLNLPANWRMAASTASPTWAAAATVVTQQASSGAPTTGGTYNFGTTAATDRAVGAMTSGTFASPNNVLSFFANNGTTNITALTIAYNAERYRVNTAAASIQFYYSLNGTSWASVSAGDIATTDFPTAANSYTFGTPLVVSRTGISISSLSIAPGSNFYLRWNINTTGANSQGIAIDDVSITATFASAAAGLSTITAGPVAAPASLSSLVNTSGAATINFSFTITDDGASDDSDPTLISQIVIGQGTNNDATLANWTQAIAGAELSDGTNTVSGTVNATNITFASLPNAATTDIGYIADNASKNYTVRIWLNASLGGTLPLNIDGKQFEFLVQTSSVTTAGTGSSGIAASQSVSSGAGTNVVAVVATQLAYVQNTTSPTGVNVAMTPAVTVSANDANGNRDLDFTSNLQATSTGTLSGSPVTVAASAGLATFSSLVHTATGTNLVLTVQRSGTLDWGIASNPFDIQLASSASDYFRSVASGNWNTTSTWESSADNSTWIPSTIVPTAAANTISIRSGHTVVITTNVTADQVEINSGGVLENASTTGNRFTLADGVGDDLIIQGGGVYHITSGLGYANYQTINSGATVNIQSGGIIRLGTGGTLGGGGNNGFLITAGSYIWNTGSVFDWNTTSTPGATGVTYFPDATATIPVLRFSAAVASVGGATALTVNGVLDANASISFSGNGNKIFRNGITGTGNVTLATTSTGRIVINGATAVLGGTGIIIPNANGLDVGTSTILTVQSAKTVDGNINLLATSFIELGGNDLTVTGNITGGSTTAYVRTNGTGALRYTAINGTARLFPVGNSTYNPVTISNGSSLDWSVRVVDAVNNVLPPYNTSKAINRSWDITPSATVVSAPVIIFEFDDSDDNQLVDAATYNGDPTRTVQTWHYNGAAWLMAGGTQTLTPANGPQAVTLTGQLDFSPFAISKTTSPLPVSFSNVRALQQGTAIRVDWSNLTEQEVGSYIVERSADGRSFSPLTTVAARANNGDKADYSILDRAPLATVNYYRVQSVEVTGRSKYSVIVKVDLSGKEPVVVLYPNPAPKGQQQLSLQATNLAKGQYTLRIISVTGQQVASQVLSHQGGSITEPVTLPASLNAGRYTLQLTNGEVNFTRSFIIQ